MSADKLPIPEKAPASPDPQRQVLPPSHLQQAVLAALVESSDDAIIGKDLNGIITSWNAGATRLFGYTPEEIVGSSVVRLIPPERQAEETEILQKLRAGESIRHYETERVRKNGGRIQVSLTVSPIRDAEGRVIGASKVARDITERKRSQEVLLQSEKLAAIGHMAGAIAHEVNNPLEAITNLAYLLSTHPGCDWQARHYAELLLNEAGRASRITRQMLTYYRDGSGPSEVSIPELLESILEVYQPVLRRNKIRVEMQFRTPAVLRGFSSELRQVFTNLIVNALDAMPDGGELVLRAGPCAVGDNRVRVTIADTGHGVPAGMKGRLFEPFFTTKSDRGTGLGLWVSRGIVQKHGGSIRFRSSTRSGHSGAVFAVLLPCDFLQEPAKERAA